MTTVIATKKVMYEVYCPNCGEKIILYGPELVVVVHCYVCEYEFFVELEEDGELDFD